MRFAVFGIESSLAAGFGAAFEGRGSKSVARSGVREALDNRDASTPLSMAEGREVAGAMAPARLRFC
jgi:hypothetical protein